MSVKRRVQRTILAKKTRKTRVKQNYCFAHGDIVISQTFYKILGNDTPRALDQFALPKFISINMLFKMQKIKMKIGSDVHYRVFLNMHINSAAVHSKGCSF